MGGSTPIRWIAEAEDLRPSGTAGTMYGKGGPRATLHCTVSSPTQFNDMHRVLIGKKAEPHLLYSFADDRLGQYFPLDASARALMGSGVTPSGLSHNRVGTVNIQIEVVGTTDDWTARPDWRPGPNFRAMMRAIASWGIRPEFVYRPATTSADRRNVVRSLATMTGDAGGWKWWGHCHYPDGESHWDPGRVNVAAFFAAAYGGGTTPTPVPEEDIMATRDEMRTDMRAIVRDELRDRDFLREVARFVLTGYTFDHDQNPDTPEGVLSYAIRDIVTQARAGAILANGEVDKIVAALGKQAAGVTAEDVARELVRQLQPGA